MQELLLDLYACSSSPDRWPLALDHLCKYMSIRSAVVQILDYKAGVARPIWNMRDTYSLSHQQNHDRILNNESNPRLRIPPTQHMVGQVAIERDEEIFQAGSVELKEIQRRRQMLEFGPNLSGIIELFPGRFLALILHQPATNEQQMGQEEERLTQQLLLHLRQAVQISGELQAALSRADLLMEAGNALGAGLVLCNDAGFILWANNEALSILERSSVVREVAGHIRAVHPGDSGALRSMLAQVACDSGERSPQLTLGRADVDTSVQIMALGLRSPSAQGVRDMSGTVALLLREPGRPLNISPAAVASLFGMSTAEARLTAGLCDGLSLRDYAQQRGISEGTARIQLKSALAKAGCPRQAELVRRVCTSLAMRLGRP